ncbi:hypothetical protein [Streptomyces sp. STCH 565 A]|uniref:hypothetical protein n=1 Tax=Streptomyces sp. STCH 565 A TaxID=2950532 RepID=UPI002076119D|nr:hypothetical protein [Streptomyces sp. STCH 565 A]MCM8548904.1 hypothetical protein [Streptomyces sp. STCH 565 A]
MARLWTCGFELQSTAALMETLSVTGTPTISTSIHRGGGASLRCNPTAATAYLEQQLDVSGVNGRSFHRFYLYITALPAAATTVYAVGQSGYFPVHVQLTATGTLQLRDSQLAANTGTASGTLAAGQWHRIELDVQESGAVATLREVHGYVGGVDFSGAAMISGSTGYSRVRIGVQTASTLDVHLDDVAVNNPTGSAQTGLPGEGQVVMLRPAGAGDANGWATAVGGTAGAANNWTRVAEVTPDDATSYNATTAAGTTTIDDYRLQSAASAGIQPWDTVTLVEVGGRVGSDAATAASIVYRLKSGPGGTVAESASVSVAVAGWRTHKAAMPYVPQLTSYADPSGSGPWTPALLDTAQIGVRSNVSQTTVRRVSALWAQAEFVPGVEPGGTPLTDLVDDFDDGVVDPVLWPESYGDVTETGGRARVPCTDQYSAYASAKAYTLTGSELAVRLYPAADGGATTEAWSQVLITTATAGTDLTIECNAHDGTLAMSLRVGYNDPGYTAIPYDPVAHAWLRVREAGGTVYWETAPDGATWTVQRSETTPGWAADADLQVQLISHRSDGTPDFAEYARLNTGPTGSVVEGAADLTAAGTLTASGHRTGRGASILTADAGLTATGHRTQAASATLTAGTGLTAAGQRTSTGAASLAADGVLAGVAARTAIGAAAFTDAGTVTAVGARTVPAAAHLDASSTAAAPGTATRRAAAALAASGKLSAESAGGATGAAALAASGHLEAAGQRTAAAGASLTAGGGLTVTGGRTVPAEATLTATTHLSATARRRVRSTAGLAAQATLTASPANRTVVTGAAALAAGSTLTATPQTTRHGTASLTGTGTLAVAIPTGHDIGTLTLGAPYTRPPAGRPYSRPPAGTPHT